MKYKPVKTMAIKLFAEHILDILWKEQELAEAEMEVLKAEAEYGDPDTLPQDKYADYRYWKGRQAAIEDIFAHIHSFMIRLGYEEY